jgi:Fe-S cluster biogenesis protein NfuA
MGKVISIEPTPNPHAKKFMLDSPVCTGRTRSFEKANGETADPLASALFAIDHVTSIFYVQEFVTVNKEAEVSWDLLERQIISTIEANVDAVTGGAAAGQPSPSTSAAASSPLLDKINAVLDEKVRPALANDGGGLNIVALDGLTLKIHYQGACGSCPSSTTGTMTAIQNVLKKEVDPGIQVVSA